MEQPKREYKGNYIHGHFVPVTDPNGEVWSKNPGDLDAPFLTFPFSYEHIHDAVTASRRAFFSWRRQSSQIRIEYLRKYLELLRNRKDTLAYWTSFEVGKPLWEAKSELNETLSVIDHFLNSGSQTTVEIKTTDKESEGTLRFNSRGVIAILCGPGLPILTTHSQFIPALLNGNTVIFKGSKQCPMLGQLFAEAAHDAGIPAGVFNLVHGDAEAARRLGSHPEIDGVFFSGSFETAAKIQKQLLTDFWKHLVIESGGKNAALLWQDCNYDKALYDCMLGAYLSSGQRATSTSRIFVHEKIFDRFLKDFHTLSKKLSVGYGLTETNVPFMGPLVSETAVEDYLRFQGIAVREGAEEIMRGKTLERDKKGFYISPSIHLVEKADPKSIYQKSEISGPNVAIFRIKDLDEAAEIINQPQFGLVASIYTGARENFMKMAEEVRVGMLHWNRPTTQLSYRSAIGGSSMSGNERFMGSQAGLQCTSLLSCIEDKSTFNPLQLPEALPRLDV